MGELQEGVTGAQFPGHWLKRSLNDGPQSLGEEEAEKLAKNGRIQGLEVLLTSKNKSNRNKVMKE